MTNHYQGGTVTKCVLEILTKIPQFSRSHNKSNSTYLPKYFENLVNEVLTVQCASVVRGFMIGLLQTYLHMTLQRNWLQIVFFWYYISETLFSFHSADILLLLIKIGISKLITTKVYLICCLPLAVTTHFCLTNGFPNM